MAQDIDRVIRRTWRYWYEDGLAEIAAACLFLAVGLLLGMQALLPHVVSLTAIGLPILVIVGMLVMRWLLAAAKERFIYPRTGYVSYRRVGGRRRLVTGIVGGAMAMAVSTLLAADPGARNWIPALQGLAFGFMWLWLAYRIGLVRYYLLGVLSTAAGLVIALTGLGEVAGSAAYFGVQSVAMLASGAWALRNYLRQTQPFVETLDNGR